jgi:hypothetical protein
MRFHGPTLLLLLIAAVAVSATDRRPANVPNDNVSILAPAEGAAVQTLDKILIESKQAGYPVVVVRADERNALWWAQPELAPHANGRFTASCHFGNAKTPAGKAFHVTVALLRTPQDVARFQEQGTFRALPSGLAWSQPLRVVRAATGRPSIDGSQRPVSRSQTGVVTAPARGAQVTRLEKVQGRIQGQLPPVVLVRSTEPNSPWWVQSIAARDSDGAFAGTARFGNDKTAPGSRFLLVVVSPRNQAEADQFQVGTTLKTLAEELPRTDEVEVTLAAPQASAP